MVQDLPHFRTAFDHLNPTGLLEESPSELLQDLPFNLQPLLFQEKFW